MDLIGSIKLIENTLGRRHSSQPKSKHNSKNTPHNSLQENNPQNSPHPFTAWEEIQLGRNIDTTA